MSDPVAALGEQLQHCSEQLAAYYAENERLRHLHQLDHSLADSWYGFVLVRETDGTTGSVPMTECGYCWALVLEARYSRHLASHESTASREANEARRQ